MPYIKSDARCSFETDLNRQLLVIRLLGQNGIVDKDIRSYVLSSAVALSSVALELYIETLIMQWGALLKVHGVSNSLLPAELRWFMVFDTLLKDHTHRYAASRDEGALLAAVKRVWGGGCWTLLDDARTVDASINLKTIVNQKRYPSPKNVKIIFNRIGVGAIFNELNRIAKTDVELALESFNDVRNNFAHAGRLVGFSVNDVKRKVRDLTKIVNAIDRIFHRHVSKKYGSQFWPK